MLYTTSSMKIRNIILAIFVTVLAVFFYSQVTVALAQTGGQLSPLTSPITYYTYTLSGRIGYRLLNGLIPAAGVRVQATNFYHPKVYFVTQTNTNGYYSLKVTQASSSAVYTVLPNDGSNTSWTPSQIKTVVSDNLNGLSFIGTQSSSSAQTSL